MTFEDFSNLFTLFCSIVGLLACIFKYIEHPKRSYLFLIIFFLGHFFSDYYWAIYMLITHEYPLVSEFVAYSGWNIAYFFIIFAVNSLRKKKEHYFHPLMLWPLLTNIPLFVLYIQFGGLFNNIWQVGTTTIAMILCMRELLYYRSHKKDGVQFPHLALLIFMFLFFGYGMWTSSCFDWKSEIGNPYLYFTILAYSSTVFFAWAAEKDYENDDGIVIKKDEAEFRLQALLQTITSFLILVTCTGGYFIVFWLKDASSISAILFLTTLVLILLVMSILHLVTSRYKIAKKKNQNLDSGKLSKINFLITIFITLLLMGFAVIHNTRQIYKSSVAGVYEESDDKVKVYSTELENYLTVSETTLKVTADTIDLMNQKGASIEEIKQFLLDQTNIQTEHLDENFIELYAFINGTYLDGFGWTPPEGFNPVTRDWYKFAVQSDEGIVIVSPYVDAHTGYSVITFAKSIPGITKSGDRQLHNVVGLDVIVNHIQEITENIDIAGKGYGMVVNEDGFIVSHGNEELNGKNIADVYDWVLMTKISANQNSYFQYKMNDENCTLFVYPVLNQWYAVVVVNNLELFEGVHAQLVINIMISLIIFALILFFFYLGYKNERNYGFKVEEMNVQVVSALATAIDAKDTYTNGHSSRVAEYSKMIAARLGFSKANQDEIYMMGLLHDVGKIGVLDDIIKKPGKLTPEEFELIKKHPVIGSSILESIKERPGLAVGARWHHEHYDGSGYPDGIAGNAIPEEARIIAVADAYDAMTSSRSYRELMPQEKVREEIEKGMGTQFDPVFAEIMLEMIDEDPDYTMCGK